ncbi:unnamed protein product, partial [Allacma fusca]
SVTPNPDSIPTTEFKGVTGTSNVVRMITESGDNLGNSAVRGKFIEEFVKKKFTSSGLEKVCSKKLD